MENDYEILQMLWFLADLLQVIALPHNVVRVWSHKVCFCCRPDGIGTVTGEEKEKFDEIKERLRILLENQITHFRYVPNTEILIFNSTRKQTQSYMHKHKDASVIV